MRKNRKDRPGLTKNRRWKMCTRLTWSLAIFLLFSSYAGAEKRSGMRLGENSVQEAVTELEHLAAMKMASEENVTVKGIVKDKQGTPLPGVTILLKGTTVGVTTDADGKYSLAIPKQENIILVFKFIGMKSVEVKYSGQKEVNVTMEVDEQELEEFVVTGYGNVRKESFTGSSTTISRDQMLKVSPTNVFKAIQAFEPSFKMIQNNAAGSDPNTMAEYYIRGRSGVSEIKELDKLTADDVSEFALKNNPSAPIFIMDGFEVEMEKIFDLDPNRLESITILKDAAATAIYGSRAANGVIVITTRMPKSGEIVVNYSGTLAVTAPDLTSYDLLSAEEALQAEYLAGLYNGTSVQQNSAGVVNYTEMYNNILRGIETDWISKPLQTQTNHSHSLYLEGGSKELRWGLEGSYKHEGGVMKGSFRDTYGAGLTLIYNHKNKLQIRNKVSADFQQGENSPYGSFGEYVKLKPYLTPYDPETGSPYKYFQIYRTSVPPNGATNILNPIYEASLQSFDKTKYKRFMNQLNLTWFINPYLSLRGQFAASFKFTEDDDYVDPASSKFYSSANDSKGTYSDIDTRVANWTANASLSYMRVIDDHNLNFSGTIEASESKTEATYVYYKGFPYGSLPSPSSALEVSKTPTNKDSYSRSFGGLMQFNYSYKNIYLFDLSGRLEGSSSFGSKEKTGFFWSTGAGLNIHNYDFVKDLGFVDQFRITGTYGETGKANFSPYQARTTYEVNTDEHYTWYRGMALKALGNENLKWEKVQTLNLKTDISVFKNRFYVSAEYYHATTVDQVTDLTIRSSSGFTTYKGNMGEILNEGIDLDFRVLAVNHNDLQIHLYANANMNKNEITKIGTALEDYNKAIDSYFGQFSSNSSDGAAGKPFTKYEVGNSLSAIYGMKSLGIDPARGDEMYVRRDGTTTHVWASNQQQCLGDSDPDVSGSFGINASWKGFSLYAMFAYQWGGQAYNQTLQQIENVNLKSYSGDRRILTDRWKQYGDVTILKDIADQTYVTRPTSRFVQDQNELRLSSLSIDYTFKREWISRLGLSQLRLQFNMSDLFTLSTVKQERGTNYPFARTFNFSLNASF